MVCLKFPILTAGFAHMHSSLKIADILPFTAVQAWGERGAVISPFLPSLPNSGFCLSFTFKRLQTHAALRVLHVSVFRVAIWPQDPDHDGEEFKATSAHGPGVLPFS